MSKKIVERILIASCCLLCLVWGAPSQAQKSKPKAEQALAHIGDAAVFRSDSVQYQAVDMAKLKGKVVLVYNWSTKCAVCLDKMMELRNNVAGWKGKPFELLMINRDFREQDYWDYLNVVKQLHPANPQMIFIHAKELAVDNLFRPGQLPMVFLLDTSGVLKYMHVGRMPPEAWDQVADLMP